jgi:hypothetical protein
MIDESAFQNALDDLAGLQRPSTTVADPSDDLLARYSGTCAVFADWLEEQGDWRAAGYRWLSLHAKLPRRANSNWGWWRFGDRGVSAPEDLPSKVWDRMPGSRSHQLLKEYPSRCDAESALCKAILSLEPDA